MKVLVTGAGGFLGLHVVERLLAHGYNDIRCTLRDRAKAEGLLDVSKAYGAPQLEFCYGNLRSKADCARAVDGISLIFHLAAGVKGSAAELFADSVVVSRNLLEAVEAREGMPLRNTRVVLVSSFGVYGVVPLGRGAQIDEQIPMESHPAVLGLSAEGWFRTRCVASRCDLRTGRRSVLQSRGIADRADILPYGWRQSASAVVCR